MPKYNLLEYSKNYSKTTGIFWNYYRDEPNNGTVGNINYSIKDSKPFDYKTSITGNWKVTIQKKKLKMFCIKILNQFLENTRHVIN